MSHNDYIFKETFFEKIIKILGDPKKFENNSQHYKNKISKELKNLSIFNTYDFLLHDNSIDYDFNEFENEKNEFVNLYNTHMSFIVKNKRCISLKNQLDKSVSHIIKECIDKKYLNENISCKSIISQIKPETIFFILIKSSLNSFQYYKETRTNGVERVILHSLFKKNFILYLSKLVIKDDSKALIDIYTNIDKSIGKFEKERNFYYVSISLQLILMFIDIFKIKCEKTKLTNESGEYKTTLILELPDKIIETHMPPEHIPEITEPKVKYDNIIDLINHSKLIQGGLSTVELSSISKKALTLSHSKKFFINENCINLFKILDQANYDVVKDIDTSPFIPASVIEHHRKELRKKGKNIDNKIIPDIMKGKKKLKEIHSEKYPGKKFYLENFHQQLSLITSIDIETLEKYDEYYKLEKELEKMERIRKLSNTIIRMAEIFKGFPIYFSNSYDYRLRMYPHNYMFNRTSGIFKYLLNEEAQEVDINSVRNMIKGYYQGNMDNMVLFQNINDRDSLSEKFYNIEIDNKDDLYLKNDSFFYRTLLALEIIHLKKNDYKTGFMLEIDQKSSASVILAYVFGDMRIASEANLIFKNEKKDINNYIKFKSFEWYKKFISEKSNKILSDKRVIHKSLFMCYIYNESDWGRRIKLKEYFDDYKDYSTIATKYTEFINTIFPNLNKKKERFNAIIKYYLDNTNDKPIRIETVDGSAVSWIIFNNCKTKKNEMYHNIKINDPVNDKTISLKYSFYDYESTNRRKIISGMLPNLIHSIDGAVMRLIINDIYDKNSYVINHLHDSIQFHPSKYDIVYDSIRDVYTSDNLHNILENKVFKHLRLGLLEECRNNFDKLILDFYSLDYTDLKITKEDINVEAMFPPE